MQFFSRLFKSEINPEFREQQRELPISVYKKLNEWTTIKQIPKNNGESYFFMERKGVDSVAFILIDNNRPDCIGLINQYRGSYGEFQIGCFTGSLDKPNLSLAEIVKEEVLEEAGYDIPLENIYFVSKEITGSMSNERVNLYVVDVSNTPLQETNPESIFEANTETVWVTPENLLSSTQDWKAKLLYYHLKVEVYNN